MKILKQTLTAAALATGLGLASQAAAHVVESGTMQLSPIASGAKYVVEHTCTHHGYALSGGLTIDKQVTTYGPLVVTGSYPKSTRTWAVELTNKSGRPTGAMEVMVTIRVLCGYRH
ncbi:MAG: hypothetical protein QNJ09_02605 [Paracoccaceae bacterium]|nr:hypothetical protein [Paracoccaceae bacterium]